MNVTENVRSARLVKVVRAATLISDLPASVKRNLNDAARSARLFVEAGMLDAAGVALDTLVTLVEEALPDGEVRRAVASAEVALSRVLP